MTGAAFRELKVSCLVEASHEMFLNCHKAKVREAKITLFVSGAIFKLAGAVNSIWRMFCLHTFLRGSQKRNVVFHKGESKFCRRIGAL